MGFKSRAKKKQKVASDAKGTSKKVKEEYSGEIRCDVADCENWADKKIGGRKLAFDRAVDVWGEDGLLGNSRRVSVCKSCYRVWKKAKKDDLNEWS
jgi:hypothetical protein